MIVDLNADVGESFGVYQYGADLGVMPWITSANIACGFHAGDPGVMRATVALAREHGVAVGAHPGYADLAGFGRRELRLSAREVEDLVSYQIGALAGVAAMQGATLHHVKPHGALYNMAAREAALADAIARAVSAVDRRLVLYALAGSELIEAGLRAGLRVASEAFPDRGYRADGSLAPRGHPGAVITAAREVVARAVTMVRDRSVTALDGGRVALSAETLCLHGDTPGAAELAKELRAALDAASIRVAPVR